MKFECRAPQFLEAVRKGRVMFNWRAVAFDTLLDDLQEALPALQKLPVYVVREPANETVDETLAQMAREWIEQDRIRLPFQSMFWEFTVTEIRWPDSPNDPPTEEYWLVHACTEGDAVFLVLYFTSADRPNAWFRISTVCRIGGGKAEIMRLLMKEDDPEEPGVIETDANMSEEAIKFVCAALVMLSSPAVEIEAVRVPKEINRGRRLMKRPTIPDHSVIRLPRVVYANGGGEGAGTGRRPRTHWRRPHQREYKPGQFTEIPLTLVARKEGEAPPPPPVVEIVTRR